MSPIHFSKANVLFLYDLLPVKHEGEKITSESFLKITRLDCENSIEASMA